MTGRLRSPCTSPTSPLRMGSSWRRSAASTNVSPEPVTTLSSALPGCGASSAVAGLSAPLQEATWAPGVDLDDDEARATLLAAVHTGRPVERSVGGMTVKLSVVPSASGDARPGLTRASWFTPAGFALLNLREDLDPHRILNSAVAATRRAGR